MADLATLQIPLQTLITRGRCLCPKRIYFRDEILYSTLRGSRINFKHKSFPSTTSKTADLATRQIPLQSLIT
jgi:hypothetical protein